MGSILAETIEAERIEHIIKPVKDLFGSIFCVGRYAGRSGCPGAICMACHSDHFGDDRGEGFSSSFGVLLSGQPLKTSIQSGFSLAQIGEFAFIIAALGVSLKVLDEYVYPIIVAVSVITTFTTPYFIRLSE